MLEACRGDWKSSLRKLIPQAKWSHMGALGQFITVCQEEMPSAGWGEGWRRGGRNAYWETAPSPEVGPPQTCLS